MPENDDNQNSTPADDKSQGDGTDWKAEAEKWKALARKHEQQARSNYDELQKLQADSDASKSDMDKVTEKLAALEKRAEEAESKALRAEIAQSKGLTAAQAKRLQGGTKEELEADADDLLEAFTPKSDKDADEDEDADKADRGTRPKERLRGGADYGGDDDAPNPSKLADDILSSGL